MQGLHPARQPRSPKPLTPLAITARHSATVAGWTLVSRITGLLRVVVMGSLLGPTSFANAFQAGYFVPHLLFMLIAGPVLAMVLVPALVRAVSAAGLLGARELLARVAGWLLAVSAIGAGLLMLLSPAVAWTLTFGIADPAQHARALLLTTLLVLFVAPQVPLYTLAHLGMAAQQARGRFVLAAGAPTVEHLVLIVTVALAGLCYRGELTAEQVPAGLVVLLGLGSTLAVALHTAVQYAGARRVGLPVRLPVRRRPGPDPQVCLITRRLVRSLGVAGWPAAGMYVVSALASPVSGGVFVVQLAHTMVYSLSFVGARAVSVAALPALSHAASCGDRSTFGSAWRRGLSYAIIASLPLLVLLALLATPTAIVLTGAQLRHVALTGPLSTCLVVAAVAQLVGGMHDIGRQALFARLDDRVPRRASQAAFGVTVVIASASLLLPVTGARLIWLMLAGLAGEVVAAAVVLTALRRAIHPERFLEPRPLLAALLAALALVPVAGTVGWVQQADHSGRLAELSLLLTGGVSALGVYLLAFRLAARRLGGIKGKGLSVWL